MIAPLPPIAWQVYLIPIMLILILGATIFYVRSRARIGFNDAPPEQDAEEDNSLVEALRWRDNHEFHN